MAEIKTPEQKKRNWWMVYALVMTGIVILYAFTRKIESKNFWFVVVALVSTGAIVFYLIMKKRRAPDAYDKYNEMSERHYNETGELPNIFNEDDIELLGDDLAVQQRGKGATMVIRSAGISGVIGRLKKSKNDFKREQETSRFVEAFDINKKATELAETKAKQLGLEIEKSESERN